MNTLPRRLLISFTLFAAFYLGENVAVVIHELGHAAGALLDDSVVTRVVLQPMWSARIEASKPPQGSFITWSAFLTGLLCGLMLASWAQPWKRRSISWLLAFSVAAMSIGVNGTYLFTSGHSASKDVEALIYHGESQIALFILSLVMLAVATVLFAALLKGAGLGNERSYLAWVAMTQLALMAQFAVVLLLDCWLTSRNVSSAISRTWVIYPACFIGFMFVPITCAFLSPNAACEIEPPRLWKAVTLSLLGVLVTWAEIAFFRD